MPDVLRATLIQHGLGVPQVWPPAELRVWLRDELRVWLRAGHGMRRRWGGHDIRGDHDRGIPDRHMRNDDLGHTCLRQAR